MIIISRFPIGFWNTISLNQSYPGMVKDWYELGITNPMTPSFSEGDDKNVMLRILDEAAQYGMRVFVVDYRTHWRVLIRSGEEEYRRLFKCAMNDFGYHPAVEGFFVGDEPDAPDAADAFKSVRIQREMAPGLIPYLNLLPWFDWIGPRIGSQAYAPYLGRAVSEGNISLLSYDCYTQMWDNDSGYDVYFNNLYEHMQASQRNKVPFNSILLSCGHYKYRCPSEDDFRWQLSTAVAHGASRIAWFFINLPAVWDNFRNAPINQFNEHTQSFEWLSSTNRLFNGHCGAIFSKLTIDKCFHVGKSYGRVPLFEPYKNVRHIESSEGTPLILSHFTDEQSVSYWIIVNNSVTKNTCVTVRYSFGTRLEQCNWGNSFGPVQVHTDPIGATQGEGGETVSLWMAPGQLVLLREA